MFKLNVSTKSASEIKKARIAEKVKPEVKPQSESKRDVLWGTGITKAVAAKAVKAAEQAPQKTSKLVLNSKKQIVDGLSIPVENPDDNPTNEIFKVKDLPSDLMDANLTLDEYQLAAVQGLRNQKYGCLIGAAGTGKTTTVKYLLAEVEKAVPIVDINTAKTEGNQTASPDMNVAICFCSFTGRAVQQMKRALPEKYHPLCNTIHSTLGYAPEYEEREDENGNEKTVRVFRPTFTEYNQLPYKICIVDESGTVPINLWDELHAALPADCRIFLIGDLNQLPPVQGRSVLGFAMLSLPTFTLEKLHRQAEGDPIAENAHRILQGKKPLTDNETKKFVVYKVDDGSSKAKRELIAVIQHMHKTGSFNPMTDAIIVPQNIGGLGQIELNIQLTEYFNAAKRDKDGKIINPRIIIKAGYETKVFGAGDKVMLLANDNQKGLTNGMIGVVTEINVNANYNGEMLAHAAVEDFNADFDLAALEKELDKVAVEEKDDIDESERAASHIMHVKFQNIEEEYLFETAGAFKKVTQSYAFTCHKSQGGEYPTVVILAHSANIKMLSREWLYTAITRAQKRVVLMCNHRGLTHAVNRQIIKGKTIAEKAERFIALQGKEGVREPNLPEPQEIQYAKITIG